MIITPLDTGPKPPDKEVKCGICAKPLRVTHHWIAGVNHGQGHWMHASVHIECKEAWLHKHSGQAMQDEREIPDRFRNYDPHLANRSVLEAAQAFQPDSKLKTLMLIGVPARGKSRLMWTVIQQFFDIMELAGARRWVDYFLFADMVSALDREQLNRFKTSKHAFLDDVGCVESFGKERASLQQVIRARIQKNQDWTFLTIDSLRFDDGLESFAKGRAVSVYIDK